MPTLCSAPSGWLVRRAGQCVQPAGETGQGPGAVRLARYQVYVHSGVAQGPPAADRTISPDSDLAHEDLRYQINGEVLVHLEQDRQQRCQTGTNPQHAREFQCRPPHRHALHAARARRSAPSHLNIYADLQNTDNYIHAHVFNSSGM